jgi:lysophospholipase L1-like esterase
VTAATPVVVSLGDSFASGEGVGLRTPSDVTWAGLVAAAAGAPPRASATNRAPAGAVLRDQVPMALALDPDVVCVCVGLNDLFRSGGTRGDTAAGVVALLQRLRDAGIVVAAGRLHDPTRLLRFPARLERVVRAHVGRINDALDQLAAADPGVVLVDLGALVERPECWAPDRVHPSDYGHRVLAAEAARRLALPHVKVGPAPAAPTAAASWRWFARHGVPWLAQRLPELATSEPLRRRVLQAGAKTAV